MTNTLFKAHVRLVCLGMLAAILCGCEGLNQVQTQAWVRHVIPLPKQIVIERTIQVLPADVVVRVRPGATDVERNAARRLADRFKAKAQTQPAAEGKFEILLGVCDAGGQVAGVTVKGAAKLPRLPNSGQAYVIAPDGENRLVLAGLTDKGVFYAAMTLNQLLDGSPSGRRATIPMIRVLDWPDLAERGQWDGSMPGDMDRLSAFKLNLYESHAELKVAPDGTLTAKPNQAILDTGTRNAFKIVQIVNHLNLVPGDSGLFVRYPELRARNAAGQAVLGLPCFAQPRMREILKDWMCQLAIRKGVNDINVWLTEDIQGTDVCHCPVCAKEGQYAMEVRAVVDAWRAARQKNPALSLRILLTQGTEWFGNDKVVGLIPAEVGVSYYSGGGSYNVSRDPMIPRLLAERAAAGGWIGVYPTLEPQYDSTCPWSCPQLIHYRMTEFADKKLQNFCAFVQPSNRAYDLNITASAEWSWNAHGRTPREFALAWATRRGFRDPEAAADWAVTLGPVGWDVYGFGMCFSAFFDEAITLLHAQRPPELGKGSVYNGIFRYFPDAGAFDKDLAQCAKAMALAGRAGSPELVEETKVIAGFVTLLKRTYEMSSILSADRAPGDQERLQLRSALTAYLETAGDIVVAVHAWAESAGQAGSVGYTDLADTIEKACRQMSEELASYGIRSPYTSHLATQIGAWEDADFSPNTSTHKQWDVTAAMAGEGTYAVKFVWRGGPCGLIITRVALTAAAQGQPPKELSADAHEGSAAIWSRGSTYEVKRPSRDPRLTYRIDADIRGEHSENKDLGPATLGIVVMRKVLPPGTRLPEVPLEPVKPEALQRYQGPAFHGQGIRVGVLQAGHGSGSLLKHLQGVKGIDAQPLNGKPGHFAACQVIVYPQPWPNAELGGTRLAALAGFVEKGGGLIALHDAPGYRRSSPIIPEVCARGAANVIEKDWRADGTHPVVHGFKPGQALTKSYYDFITLEPGPRGEVVGRTFDGKQPVVVCGPYGKGRYVACGMCIGIGPGNTTNETPPTPDEARLLENAVWWASGQ